MKKDYTHIETDLLIKFFACEATPEEQQDVLTWRDASEEHQGLFDSFQKVWLSVGKTTAKQYIDVDAEWKRHLRIYNQSFNRQQKTLSLNAIFSIAASILLFVGIAYFTWSAWSHKTISTGLAETNIILLPDGSKVTVNAGSKLSFNRSFNKDMRKVVLEGEAFFEVERNPLAPFVIQLDGVNVKVLGTSFNVKAYAKMDKVEVVVSHGKVCIYEKNNEKNNIVVGTGEKASYQKKVRIFEKITNNNRNFISWKTRIMIFENDSMAHVIHTLQDVYHMEVIVQNPTIYRCTLTTKFIDKNLESVLKILESTLDIRCEERDNRIYINGKGC